MEGYRTDLLRDLPWRTLIALFLFLLFSCSEFIIRGPLRSLKNSNDFVIIYLSSSAWAKGQNPYDHEGFNRLWTQADGDDLNKPDTKSRPSIYWITAFPIIAPFTLLKWHQAQYLWISVICSLFFIQIILMISIMELHKNQWQTYLFIGLILALAPIHTAIKDGQPCMITISCIIISIALFNNGKVILAGIILAIGICIKPHIGLPILFFYAIRRQWRVCASIILACIMITLVAIMRLGIYNFEWLFSLKDNLNSTLTISGSSDPSNVYNFPLLNIHYLLNMVTTNHYAVNTIIILLILVQVVIFIKYYNNGCIKSNVVYVDLLHLSIITVFSILPFYHRFYDASLLVFPIAFAIVMLNTKYNNVAKLLLMMTLPFLIPGPGILGHLVLGNHIDHSILMKWWFKIIIAPHCIWFLIIIIYLLNYIMVIDKRGTAGIR
jgi:hypothetical protein